MPLEKLSYEQLQERLAEAHKVIGESDLETEGSADTAGLALVGGGYVIGDVEFAPITMSSISLLQVIESPFLGGGDDDLDDVFGIDLQSVIESLFVMASGVDAVRPLIALKHRLKAAANMERLAASKPEYFVAYMTHVDKITTTARTEFSENAAVFGEALGSFNLQDAIGTIDRMFSDAMDGFNMLPESGVDSEKKTGGSTVNGSVESVV